MKATQYNDTIRHAIAYAEADRSDPFTFNRVMSHIANGICDDNDSSREMKDCRYRADRNVDSNGRVYYSNLSRP
jgi:hypothetical protein